MSSVKANNYYDASGGSNAQLYGVASPPNSMGFRNRILNGSMVIDQRNAGASVTIGATTNTYTLDRWAVESVAGSKFSVQQSTVAPAGFTNSLLVTSLAATSVGSTDYYSLRQRIEGFNTADLGWGTVGAQTVTLSFWVRSSLTGTFGGVMTNSANNRSYPFSYSISAANTWEQKTVTVAGDTTGTWLTNNGVGIAVYFSLGMGSTYSGTAGSWVAAERYSVTGATSVVGTNGATFYITGVQLEAGTVASPFERRDFGRELLMCQRYYEKTFDLATAPANNLGTANGEVFFSGPQDAGGFAGNMYFSYTYKVPKRGTPTLTVFNSRSATAGTMSTYAATVRADTTPIWEVINQNQICGLVQRGTLAIGAFTLSAEL